jgi:hypothetical protein
MHCVFRVICLLSALLLSACFFEADMETDKIPGFKFGYLDIERFCSVKRMGQDHLIIECEQARLLPMAQSCTGFITGGLKDTQLNCSGKLWPVKERCKIKMTRVNKGILDCKL